MLQATEFHQLHLVRTKEIVRPQNIEFPFAENVYQLCIGDRADKRSHDVPRKKKAKSNSPDDHPEQQLDAEATDDRQQSKDADSTSYDPDIWTVSGNSITRVHNVPRKKLYVPGPEDECPVDLKYIDVFRDATTTIVDIPEERHIDDFWVPVGSEVPDRELSDWWTGKTTFFFVMPKAKKGHELIFGRETKIQETSGRPDHVWPETWRELSKKNRSREVEIGKNSRPLRQEARSVRGLDDLVQDDDAEDYEAQFEIARKEYSPKVASPAMPVIDITHQQSKDAENSSDLQHRELFDYNIDNYLLVARPVPHSEIKKTPRRSTSSTARVGSSDRQRCMGHEQCRRILRRRRTQRKGRTTISFWIPCAALPRKTF